MTKLVLFCREIFLLKHTGFTQPMSNCILVVDDDQNVRMSLDFLLSENGYTVVEAQSPNEALVAIKNDDIALVLADMNYHEDTTSGAEGLKLITSLRNQYSDLPIVALTAWADVQLVVAAMQAGAGDFIEKPWDNTRLLQIIKQQLTIAKLRHQNRSMATLQYSQGDEHFDYSSDSMLRLVENIKRVAPTEATVLLTGENGTGKSTIAKQIHQQSHRAQEPFIDVNMGAIPSELFESEMFGHKKGAFTGASENRLGRFEMAKGGTLFLDEVGTLTPAQQVKLLRVLETGDYEAVGSSVTHKADVRLISASNCDFEQLIQEGLFRQDLYFRLNPIELHIPSLSQRKEDIKGAAEYFLNKFGMKYQRRQLKLTPSAIKSLERYQWPGNIRELSHVMERAALLCHSDNIDSSDLQLTGPVAQAEPQSRDMMTLEEGERQLILQAMEKAQGKTQNAAELLGITAGALYRRLDKFKINEKN